MTTVTRRPLVVDSVLELIGATPMVRLNRIAPPPGGTILGKLESLNPGGSVKDRIALSMIEAAERDGRLKPGATIVEPTSGTIRFEGAPVTGHRRQHRYRAGTGRLGEGLQGDPHDA
jgi:hypothetical protein